MPNSPTIQSTMFPTDVARQREIDKRTYTLARLTISANTLANAISDGFAPGRIRDLIEVTEFYAAELKRLYT